MKVAYRTFDLPLRHVFTIARGSMEAQTTFIVELTHDGQRGYGEATTNDYYGATAEAMAAGVESVRSLLEAGDPYNPESLLAELAEALPDNSFALCALDLALHDLWGKLQGAPVYKLWGLSINNIPPSDYTIGIDSIDKMVEKLREMPGWPVYKIKLGTSNDIDIVRALRQETDARFRVDANCGWSAEQTIEFSHALAQLDVEFIEQPQPPGDDDAARAAYTGSVLPLIADESCITEEDVSRCAGQFHGINIKLTKCGGLAPARRMIAEARELDLSVMCGCMTETTVGISAIAQLLPLLDYVDMDGAVLLAKDIASGVKVDRGICHFPARNGTGVELLDGPLGD